MSDITQATQPRFAIVNEADAPARYHVAEWIEGVGYCYMARTLMPRLKQFDGMTPRRPTPIEAFGFDPEVREYEVVFHRTLPCTATYEDGKPRRWQDEAWSDNFTLPRVRNVKQRAA